MMWVSVYGSVLVVAQDSKSSVWMAGERSSSRSHSRACSSSNSGSSRSCSRWSKAATEHQKLLGGLNYGLLQKTMLKQQQQSMLT
jgi:hypothetical protein